MTTRSSTDLARQGFSAFLPASPLTWLALRTIGLYQRYLSPRKGYCCALHALGGGRSCSAYGYRAIARGGVARGLVLLRRRLAACARVSLACRPAPPRYPAGTAYQRGFCDVTCDGIDCCTGLLDALDGINLINCGNCPPPGCGASWDQRRFWGKPDKRDFLNNQNALRDRIEKAQARARQESQDRR